MRRLSNWQLFAVCVLTWGTTWHAITYQLGHTAPAVGVAYRFALAGALVLAACALGGVSVRFAPSVHARLALQGGFMYGLAYVSVYHAEQHLPSGLVAVGYSASPLVSGLGARMLFGTRLGPRFVPGGLLGIAGVALIFWPEFNKAGSGAALHGGSTALGVLFTVLSVLLSTVGSLAASRNRDDGLAFWPAFGWGMVHGAAVCLLLALLLGQRFTLPTAFSWWASLLYLALAGSVLAFASFLTLQDRIGPGPAGSVGVMTPLLALLVSLAFENYRPDLLTGIGALLAVAGNVLILRRPAARAPAVGPGR